MRYLLVEGITDVAFVKYICCKNKITPKYNNFKKITEEDSQVNVYQFQNLYIINIKGQDNLEYTLENLLKPIIDRIEKIAILQDADNNFEESTQKIEKSIKESQINKEKIEIFLTPNNKDLGDLETLLLSTIKTNDIVSCFDGYKKCLESKQEIHPKALKKGQVYAYTMYSQSGENLHKPQNSFMYKKDNEFIDTKLWDLEKYEFSAIKKFVINIFS